MLELNPLYQRGVVWDEQMMMNFIDSVIRGYIPNNIIINKGEAGLWTCIDGKQRLTSILKFYTNQIPYEIENDSDDDQTESTYVYFSQVPDKCKYKNFRSLTKDERQELFLDRRIPVAFYDKLTYEVQADLFNRIQYSRPLTPGEKNYSKFSNEAAIKKFKELCTSRVKLFDKSIQDRDNHVTYILNLMYMLDKDKTHMMSQVKRETAFMKVIDNDAKITPIIKETTELLDGAYTSKIMRHNKVKALPMRKNFQITITYLIKPLINNFQDDDIVKIIVGTWNRWNRNENKDFGKSTDVALQKLKEIFDKEKAKYAVTKSESNEAESDETDETETEESSTSSEDADTKTAKTAKPVRPRTRTRPTMKARPQTVKSVKPTPVKSVKSVKSTKGARVTVNVTETRTKKN